MAESTLSPVGFDRPFVKANIPVEQRFALACLSGQHDANEPDTVRMVLFAGLYALGWTEQRSIEEYAAYRVQCLQDGKPNEFEGR